MRDSMPWAMLTRSSTCNSAGSSVLKSKCVMLSKYDSLLTLSARKMVVECLENVEIASSSIPANFVAEARRAVDQAEITAVVVLEQTFAQNSCISGLYSRRADRFGMIDS